MKINLNNPLVIGTISAPNDAGKHTFTRWATTNTARDFLNVAQYLIDGCPDVSSFCIVDIESQAVIDFAGLVFDTLGLKSKRYSRN